jgi:hypothetical protein
MKSVFATTGALAAALGLGACATVTRGDHTAWAVNTTPPGASVKTTNGFYCDSTPCSIQMPRRSNFSADISKPGYKTLKVTVTHQVSVGGGVAMAGNVLVGGVIGGVVDIATGSTLDLSPNPVTVTLEKDDAPAVAAAVADAPVATAPAPAAPAAPPPATPVAAAAAAPVPAAVPAAAPAKPAPVS